MHIGDVAHQCELSRRHARAVGACVVSFPGSVHTPGVRPAVCFELKFLWAMPTLERSSPRCVESYCMPRKNLHVAEGSAALRARRAPKSTMLLPDMRNKVAPPLIHEAAVRTSKRSAGTLRCHLASQPTGDAPCAHHRASAPHNLARCSENRPFTYTMSRLQGRRLYIDLERYMMPTAQQLQCVKTHVFCTSWHE